MITENTISKDIAELALRYAWGYGNRCRMLHVIPTMTEWCKAPCGFEPKGSKGGWVSATWVQVKAFVVEEAVNNQNPRYGHTICQKCLSKIMTEELAVKLREIRRGMKLSSAQHSFLHGVVFASHCGSASNYSLSNKTANALKKRGLVQMVGEIRWYQEFGLTEAGIQYLIDNPHHNGNDNTAYIKQYAATVRQGGAE